MKVLCFSLILAVSFNYSVGFLSIHRRLIGRKLTQIKTAVELSDNVVSSKSVVIKEADENNYSAPLIKDIEILTEILGEVVRKESPAVYKLYEKFKSMALSRANFNDKSALPEMIECGKRISSDDTVGTIRAFTQTLALINAAEVYHRMRLLRNADIVSGQATPLPMREDSVAGTIEIILNRETGKSPAGSQQRKTDILEALLQQTVDIVLTAHPTEVNRRIMLRKYRRISETLAILDRTDLAPYEKAQAEEALRREIFSIWGSDEIRRLKPTPQMEASGGIAIIETVLWDAVPAYLRRLSAQVQQSLGQTLPLDHVPIRFSSWMGGDRDGNPNVTPKVTFEVATRQRLQAAKLILSDVTMLYNELAICKGFSPDLLALAAKVQRSSDNFEKYRRVLGHLRLRLLSTIKWCEEELEEIADADQYSLTSTRGGVKGTIAATATSDGSACGGDASAPLFDAAELLHDLRIMHESLCLGGYTDVADGLLVDIIRRVSTFGLTLVPLDIRQESTRHKLALDAITEYLGLGSYASWDETTKIDWLQAELFGKRPMFRVSEMNTLGFDPLVLDTLHTIRVASTLGPGALGAYVISQATSASDVLAVMVLQKQFSMTAENGRMLRVVPLFETLQDLTNAAKVVETLFSLPGYVRAVRGKQEIMVGYSDSAKDAGRLAACWAQYESQEQMVQVAEKFGVDLTFFHGKGGTVGRGGNPALYRAVLAHPPKTVNGKFRVTEQGEMITQNFGSTGIAERTLDIYTAAVLAEKFVQHVEPKSAWRQRMNVISESSCSAYRTAIQETSFIKYFRTITPELELGSLNIGSRPAKRNPAGGIESLRAIPWQFAWTQIRLHLPAWLGVGAGLDTTDDDAAKVELQEMYDQWPFFREVIDLIAMTLSKTDAEVFTNYETQLGQVSDQSALTAVGDDLRRRLANTRNNVLGVTRSEDFSSGFQLLKESMQVRNPYVDPLNVLQAEVMKRLRNSPDAPGTEQRAVLEDAFIVSVNGIAQGMKNSG